MSEQANDQISTSTRCEAIKTDAVALMTAVKSRRLTRCCTFTSDARYLYQGYHHHCINRNVANTDGNTSTERLAQHPRALGCVSRDGGPVIVAGAAIGKASWRRLGTPSV